MDPNSPIAMRVAFTFCKQGRAIFFSHHDIMRFFERAMRRAKLPLLWSRGFNPRPKIIFPHPLSVGIASFCEQVETPLISQVNIQTILAQLQRACQPLIEISTVHKLPAFGKSRQARESVYVISLFPETGLKLAVEQFMLAESIQVTRQKERETVCTDIRPFVKSIKIISQQEVEKYYQKSDSCAVVVNSSVSTAFSYANPALSVGAKLGLEITVFHQDGRSSRGDDLARHFAGVTGVVFEQLQIARVKLLLQ